MIALWLALCIAAPQKASPKEVKAIPVATRPRDLGSPKAVPEYSQVALMPLSSLGSTDDAAAAVQRVLFGELKNLLGDRLVTVDELAARDRALAQNVNTCEGSVDCLLEVFGASGWGAFIIGSIAGLGNDRLINLKLIDVKSGGELRRANEGASGEEALLIREMRKAAVVLLAPDLFVGALEINAPQPGLQITIDGTLAGTTPLKQPRLEIVAGHHALEARGPGLVPFSGMVDIGYGETVTLNINLPENTVFVGGETPFHSRWWTWAIAVAGATTMGAGGYFYKRHLDTAHELENSAKSGDLTYRDAKLYREWNRDYKTATYLYGGGGVMVLGAAFLWTLDLF